jgi:ketosteroid isomerase-like protein
MGLVLTRMSEENLETIRRGFVAASENDWPTALATIHPQAKILDYDVPDAGTYHGHKGFMAWIENWGAGWDDWRIENPEFRPAGEDGVIALFHIVARGKGSGIEIGRDDAVVYRLQDGQIVRLEYFNDQAKALEAAGLSERAI